MVGEVRQAFIGVGANLGDRWATIRKAQAALAREPGIATVEPSAVFETAPVGVTDQPLFLNLVLGIETSLTPERLLEVLHALEMAAGRRREREVRWGPRPLDLDLLLFEGETRTGPGLILPHPRMWERAFVLAPLRELLARSARFERAVWADLRARLTSGKAEAGVADGVARWNSHPE
jgi:2-amino-4-hydroxy-6-hydroxymethyldihydropteridine diphosphokinase